MNYSWSLIAASNSFHIIWEFSFEISAKERILRWLLGLAFVFFQVVLAQSLLTFANVVCASLLSNFPCRVAEWPDSHINTPKKNSCVMAHFSNNRDPVTGNAIHFATICSSLLTFLPPCSWYTTWLGKTVVKKTANTSNNKYYSSERVLSHDL